MANILSIETTSNLCSVALSKGEHVFELSSQKPLAHAEVLADIINQILINSNLKPQDLDAIAISEGPGSYTGLRIGTATAKGICVALNIPLIAVSTLQSIALAAQKTKANRFYWAMIDARRMEVYQAIYDENLKPISTVNNLILDQTAFEITEHRSKLFLCGDGAKKSIGLTEIEISESVFTAKEVLELAIIKFEQTEFVDLDRFEPFYLKGANITISKKTQTV